MRAVRVVPGSPDRALEVADLPVPRPGAGEVRISVVAAGVNRADLGQRAGRYDPPHGVTDVLGLECAGVIAEVGDQVTDWAVGDRVCALLDGGGYAEQVVVAATQLFAIPDEWSYIEASALPESMCTAWFNLFGLGQLRAGEFVLIHGGAGGIGTMAVQLARRAGATVAVTAGGPAKLAVCERLGASVLIDYTRETFSDVVARATDGRGADVILDVIGAGYLEENLATLAEEGRLVVIGLQGGHEATIDLRALIAGRKRITGSMLRHRRREDKARIVVDVRREVLPAVVSRDVDVVIDRVFPLAEAADALRLIESSGHVGKIVLVTDLSVG